jgi:hypothetical protein
LPEDLAAAISESDALYAGGLEADFLAGADATVVFDGAAAGVLDVEGFDAGAVLLAGALVAGAESADAAVEESVFLLFFDFLVVVESAGAAEASVAAASLFLLFLDFLVVVASAV